MDQELLTILANIGSLVDQAQQMGAGEPAEEAPVVMESDDENADVMPPEDDDELLKKVLSAMKGMDSDEDDEDDVEKSDEGTQIGEDKAEALIDDLPPETDKAISAVAKMILSKLNKSRQVKKTRPEDKVAKALALLASRQVEVEKALTGIIKSSGLADEITRINEVQKSKHNTTAPVNDTADIQKTLEQIKNQLGSPQQSISMEERSLHKSLSDNDGEALKAIFSVNAKK